MTPQPKPFREHLTKAQFKRRAFDVFERDGYQCQYCERTVFDPHCHHRIFKSQGGDDSWDNLACTCFECHDRHGDLKDKKLFSELDDTKIKELKDRYKMTFLSPLNNLA